MYPPSISHPRNREDYGFYINLQLNLISGMYGGGDRGVGWQVEVSTIR